MLKKIAGKWALIFILIILAIAVFFRFWQLEQIPPGLYPDVAVNGTNALDALKTGQFKLFYPDNNGREGLFINLIALSFWLFGASIWAIKVVPAIIGVLTVLGLYLFAKQLFSYLNRAKAELLALFSAFFISVGFWHVNFSRLGFRAIMVPFFLVWSFYFLFKAVRATRICGLHADDADKSELGTCPSSLTTILYFILAGLFFGLGFHTYISYRLAPLILLPIIFFETITYWPQFKILLAQHLPIKTLLKRVYITDGWWRWDIFFAVVIIAALPMILYFAYHPQDFIGRAGQVSVFSAASPLKELFISTGKTLGMFNVWGDCNWRHNYACQPILLWPVGLLFVVGFFYSIVNVLKFPNYKAKRWPLLAAHWTLLFWFFAMLLPSILSMEGLPHSLRSIGAITPVFIFAGLGLFLISNILKNLYAKKCAKFFTLYLLLFLFLSSLAYIEFNKYFLDWGQKKEVKDEFTQRLVNQANYLNSLPDNIIKYIMVNEGGVPVPYPDGIPMPAQTIIFLSYGKPNIKYSLPSQNSQILISSKPTVLLPLRYDGDLFSQLKEKIPDGKIEEINKEFSVFKIGF